MSIREAAQRTGLSPKALRRRIERGTLASVMVAGRRRIPRADLVARGLMRHPADDSSDAPAPRDIDRRLAALESRVAALEAAREESRAASEPARTDSAASQPVPTDPAASDSAATDPANSTPARTNSAVGGGSSEA